jgi:hypothetical protein
MEFHVRDGTEVSSATIDGFPEVHTYHNIVDSCDLVASGLCNLFLYQYFRPGCHIPRKYLRECKQAP